jgi:7,8-dihydro-6-hydroxymethylpterin-pyrophosphokinase
MTLAWIGLGANLGDAAATVGAAIAALDGCPGPGCAGLAPVRNAGLGQ